MVVENRFHAEFGEPSDSVRGKVRDHMHPWVQEFIGASPFAVLSTSDADGHCDASPRGGQPGFIKVLDDRHLLIPDVRGNNLFHSYGNIDRNPHAALLFLIPGLTQMVRVNGAVEVVSHDDITARGLVPEVHDPDDRTQLLQGLLLTVHEAYGHCPRSVNFARLWNTETIASHTLERPIGRRPRGV